MIAIRVLLFVFATVVLVLTGQSSAFAAKAKLSAWYCSVLKTPFDPAKAFKDFPLEKLSAPVEKREIDDDKHVHVSITATGDDYEVEYRYSFKQEDVGDVYGMNLSVDSKRWSADQEEASLKWLREFGRPSKDMFGWHVGAGPPMMGLSDPPFKFAVWANTGRILAEWFHQSDIKHAAKLCK